MMYDTKDLAQELFQNTQSLAPMVRAGTLPLRLLSLRYGADTVYGEEIIDRKTISTNRKENKKLNTIDFVTSDGKCIVFRTCLEERKHVVYQIGTADATYALQAAEKVCKDVAAIDINMGCPKKFSIQGGMGAALLDKPELASDIIKTLKRNLNIPVSFKMRLLPLAQQTLDFARGLEMSGADAVAVHARYANERPCDQAHWENLTPLVSSLSIPVIANGDVFSPQDIQNLKETTGCSSVMIARGALHNPSLFSSSRNGMDMKHRDKVVKDYLSIADQVENVFQNTKYVVNRMHGSKDSISVDLKDVEMIKKITKTKTAKELYDLWDVPLQTQSSPETNENNNMNTVHSYDDDFCLKQAFFCSCCQLQCQSEIDLKQHLKGRKHKKNQNALASDISYGNVKRIRVD